VVGGESVNNTQKMKKPGEELEKPVNPEKGGEKKRGGAVV